MNEVFSHAESNGIPTRCSYQNLKLPHRKTNQGLGALSYIGPPLWNKLNKSLKVPVSLNAFKHNLNLFVFDICYCKIFYLFLIFSFSNGTAMKIRLFQLFLCYPNHNFVYLTFNTIF